MDGDLIAWALLGGAILVICMMFAATRAVLSFVLGQFWTLALHLIGIAFGLIQAALMHVWRAHMIVGKNLMPRNSVLPSVSKKTVRRE